MLDMYGVAGALFLEAQTNQTAWNEDDAVSLPGLGVWATGTLGVIVSIHDALIPIAYRSDRRGRRPEGDGKCAIQHNGFAARPSSARTISVSIADGPCGTARKTRSALFAQPMR